MPRRKLRLIDKLAEEEQQAKTILDLARKWKIGQQNLVDFRKMFFPARDDVAPANFHYRWSELLLHGKQHTAIEGFRESAKTTYIMRTFPVYCLTYPSYDMDFIILISSDEDTAREKLKSIKAEYQTRQYLNSNLVRVLVDNEDIYEVEVKAYQTEEVIPVRLAVFGKGSQIRGLESKGRRPKLVILDDVQDKKAMESENILKKDWNWFIGDVMFLGETCRIFAIGNNLGDKCLMERIAENAEQLRFHFERVSALDEETESVSAWPAKISVKKLLEEKRNYQDMGALAVWYKERMCVAMSPDEQRFKKDMFRYYDPQKLPKKLNIYTTVDLAISQSKRSDFTAVCTVGVSSENHWFVLDIDYGRYTPTETMNAIFRAASKWRPLMVGWEKVAYQAVIGHLIEKEMPERNIFFRSQGLSAERRKELRIEMLAPRFATGTVWFPKGAAFLGELETELLKFPTGLHDDLIDALAYVEQLASVPGEWDSWEDDTIPTAGGM